MKHTYKNFILNTICISFCLFGILMPQRLSAQPALSTSVSGCQVTITTTIMPFVANSGEVSVGLFYRLESQNAKGSYFWNDLITTGTTATKTVSLPVGSYTVVCYEARKGGPIRTGQASFTVTTLGSCSSSVQVPTVFPLTPVAAQRVMLSASWNVFTNQWYAQPAANQHVNGTPSFSPTEPWIFVTLSVEKWASFPPSTTAIQVAFDKANLEYVGVIADNYTNSQSGNWNFIQPVTYTAGNNYVTVNRKTTAPPNGETHVHLIFKNKAGNTLGSQVSTTFTASYQNDAGAQTTTTAPLTTGTPHDPNCLAVDQRQLCPCQKGEWLTYQVNFQNKGTAPATKVTVELMNYTGQLDPASIVILPNQNNSAKKTFIHAANVTYDGANKFTIFPISLPGTNQPANPNPVDKWKTMDYFKFKIRKKDCSLAGEVIQPKVSIVFYAGTASMGSIDTNLEKTVIVSEINDKPCKKPDLSCKKCKEIPR